MSAAPSMPVVWSIAGLDTAGGAGLSADQRAADAMGVHLCPVAACLTAQHSQGVEAVYPVEPAQLEAQLQALSDDLPPRAIKLGLLGNIAAVEIVVRWVDRLRAQAPSGADPHRHLALVVDPVWGASAGGAPFSSEALREAYRVHLLPRATVVTPNRNEAREWLHASAEEAVPALAQALKDLGVRGVVVTGGDAPGDWCLDWLDVPQASGWMCAPRVPTPHHHGTGCTFATGLAAALALGHVEADAAVLASQLTRHALMHARQAGRGRGPVIARPGFASGPSHGGAPLPWLGLGTELPWLLQADAPASGPLFLPHEPPGDGLYGILPDAAMLEASVRAGLRCVQLRHKPREGLQEQLHASLSACATHGATCFVNDHWQDALEHLEGWQDPITSPSAAVHGPLKLGLHLGQEDLLALDAGDRARLRAQRHRIQLGLSSHSLWELARAAGCGPSLIACGPVQATTTKDMPWRPQGEDNLSWWVANSPAPVVAIGGLLDADDLRRFAACGPAAVCVVRALGRTPAEVADRVEALRRSGAAPNGSARRCVALPHPVL